jgi:hypothetical protein
MEADPVVRRFVGGKPRSREHSLHRKEEGVLGFYLARPYWGRGIATEAGRAFIDFGFEELGMTQIIASVETRRASFVRSTITSCAHNLR